MGSDLRFMHGTVEVAGYRGLSTEAQPAVMHQRPKAVHQRAYTSLRNALPWVHRPNQYALRIIASAPGARLALIFSRQASW